MVQSLCLFGLSFLTCEMGLALSTGQYGDSRSLYMGGACSGLRLALGYVSLWVCLHMLAWEALLWPDFHLPSDCCPSSPAGSQLINLPGTPLPPPPFPASWAKAPPAGLKLYGTQSRLHN